MAYEPRYMCEVLCEFRSPFPVKSQMFRLILAAIMFVPVILVWRYCVRHPGRLVITSNLVMHHHADSLKTLKNGQAL